MINIEIDGKKCSVADGSTIIEAADAADVYIPRFCYHKKLSIAANCRMCLVEVEGSRKTLPACATPVTDGMQVRTASKQALKSQKQVMEFLLINHPLDCPICDQGGECELQDLSMGYGSCASEYREAKRAVVSEDIGPLIKTEMTRCIHCTRCVRFGDEVAGLPELGVTQRGENSQIGTYVKHFLRSELSGNVIDLCPVGALTSKPFSFQARSWEMRAHPAIAPFDCLGSNIEVHTIHQDNSLARKVMRVVPRLNEEINEQWLSDCDRFGYEAWNPEIRVLKPKIKRDGKWFTVDWTEALNLLQKKLLKILNENGGNTFAALMSPSSTVEEGFLLQHLVRGVGGSYVEHRLQQSCHDVSYWPKDAKLALSLSEIEAATSCVLVGANLSWHQPILAHRLRNMDEEGCELHSFEPYAYPFHVHLTSRHTVVNLDFTTPALALLKAVSTIKSVIIPAEFSAAAKDVTVDTSIEKCAASLLNAEGKAAILLGADVINHPDWATIHCIWQAIAKVVGIELSYVTPGANSAGLTYAGCISNDLTLSLAAHKAFFLLDVEPEFDCANACDVTQALQAAECVVSLTAYESPRMLEYADFILPIAVHPENEGTFVNALGQWIENIPSTATHGEAKMAWKIIKVMLHLLQVPESDFVDLAEVRAACRNTVNIRQGQFGSMAYVYTQPKAELMRYGAWRPYDILPGLRRAKALQERQRVKSTPGAGVNAQTAAQLGLAHGDNVFVVQGANKIKTTLYVDNIISTGCVYMPAGMEKTANLDAVFCPVSLVKE